MFIIMQNMQQLKSAYDPYAFSHKNFLQDYEANNWLKAHGIPMRRRPLKRKFVAVALDEYNSFDTKNDVCYTSVINKIN